MENLTNNPEGPNLSEKEILNLILKSLEPQYQNKINFIKQSKNVHELFQLLIVGEKTLKLPSLNEGVQWFIELNNNKKFTGLNFATIDEFVNFYFDNKSTSETEDLYHRFLKSGVKEKLEEFYNR